MTFEGVTNALESEKQISHATNILLNELIEKTQEISDFPTFLSKVNEIESNYNTSNLPESEKYLVESSFSIFRNSAEFWNKYYGSNEETDMPEGKFRFRCFWCVTKQDLKGALLGFLIGNCLCGKLGATQPILCGAVGAVAFGALYSWASKVCPGVCNKCTKPNTSSYPSWICNLPFLKWP